MDAHNYSIQQVKFDVDFFSRERAYELQNKLSGLYHQQVHGILYDFFQKTLPENLLIRKDSLTVDLGSMRYEQLENELPRRLTAALEELFTPLLSKESTAIQWTGQGFESLSPDTADLSLMEFYLVKGVFPWQASVSHGLTWKIILDRIYTHDRGDLGNLLKRLGRQLEVRKRLAFQSSEEDMEKIIIAIIPVEASAILSYKKKITEIQQDQQIIRTDAIDFGLAVSFFILTYLLKEQGSLFSQKIFIKSVLAQMAAHYNVSYLSVLSVLHESLIVIRHKTGTAGTLFGLIDELEQESAIGLNSSAIYDESISSDDVLMLSKKISLLQYYLYNGTLPVWSAAFSLGKEELAGYLKELIKITPETLKEMILSLITASDAVLKRISELLPVNGFTVFTRFLWPAEADFNENQSYIALASVHQSGLNGTDIPAAYSGSLSAILNYFLEYGVMPWWTVKELSGYPPEVLLKNLYTLSADEALMVLKRAGLQRGSKQRFLWQFSEDLIYTIFSTLPEWQKAIIAIETSIELIESVPALSLITQLALKQLILGAIWHSYMQQDYRAFNEDDFYSGILQSLSPHGISSFNGLSKAADIIGFFKKNTGLLSLNNDQETDMTGNIIFGNLDALLLLQPDTKAPLTTEHRQQEVIGLLEYYLTWNRLPDHLPMLSRQELDNRLSEMLLLLYHENREALKRIMLSEKHSAAARMYVHKLFLPDYKGGDHKQLSLLLDDYIEKDAFQYIKEMAGTGNITADKDLKPALDRLLEKAKNGEAGEQLSMLLKSAPLTKYIALHYGDETMQWLIEKRSGSDQIFRQQMETMRNLFLDLIVDIYEKQRLKLLLNEATLFYLYSIGQPKNISGYISAVFRYLAGSVYTPPKLFRKLLNKIETDTYLGPAHKELITFIRYELTDQLQVLDRELSIKRRMESEELKIREAAAKAMEQKIAAEQLSRQQQEQTNKKTARVLEKGNKFYIGNAGLILLHPFLSTYFTRLNLMEKGQFINLETQARAVHLLQYLAFTSTSNPEHELVLNKILCNYPLNESLPLEIVISQEEADLSLELIQVVIQRAGKLSTSSPEGFRAAFLQREGILTETEEEWTLRVDQRGYDLILQTLPWAFGMIKFQWMDKPMIIEWI